MAVLSLPQAAGISKCNPAHDLVPNPSDVASVDEKSFHRGNLKLVAVWKDDAITSKRGHWILNKLTRGNNPLRRKV